jgi:hypothetical protein
MIKTNDDKQVFVICQFDRARFVHGARFVADRIDCPQSPGGAQAAQLTGAIDKHESSGKAVVAELTGGIKGTLVLLPIKLSGENRFLVYLRQADQ